MLADFSATAHKRTPAPPPTLDASASALAESFGHCRHAAGGEQRRRVFPVGVPTSAKTMRQLRRGKGATVGGGRALFKDPPLTVIPEEDDPPPPQALPGTAAPDVQPYQTPSPPPQQRDDDDGEAAQRLAWAGLSPTGRRVEEKEQTEAPPTS